MTDRGIATAIAAKRFDFRFTVECPHCSGLFELSHWDYEVFFTETKLGICPGCGCTVTLHLTASGEEA